jgi:MFS family permease
MELVSRDRRALLLVAMFVDTLGGGLFVPFELIYALRIADLSLTTSGAILSIAAATSIAIGPLAGAGVDRIGPLKVVAAANLAGIAGCGVLLLWPNGWGYGVGAFFFGVNMRVFWAAYTPLVAAIAHAHELEKWFGWLRGSRYIGLAAGQVLSGTLFVFGETAGLKLIVGLNGISFCAALILVLLAASGMSVAAPPKGEEARGGYRIVIADRLNVVLASLNVAATLLLVAPILALPVFVFERLHLPSWLPGVLTGFLTATAAIGLIFADRLVRGRRRLRNLQIATAFWSFSFALFLIAPLSDAIAYASLAVGVFILGIGEAFYAPTADALPAALGPASLRGRYAAMHQMAWGVSETIAPALVAVALAAGDYVLWTILAGLALGSAIAYRAAERGARGRDGIAGVPATGDLVGAYAARPESIGVGGS